MDVLIVVLVILVVLMLGVIIFRLFSTAGRNASELMNRLADQISESNGALRREVGENVQVSVKNLGDMLGSNQRQSQEAQSARIEDLNRTMSTQLKTLEQRFATLEQNNEQKLDAMRRTMSDQLTNIREDNNKKLDSIQKTVDEKLENKMNESFKLVSERLEQVYKGLGEMQSIASGVGDLKKVLSNVKSRGILGEIQLGAILSEILAPEQYETDIAVVPRSTNRVEFAVKLPGGDDGSCVYLPIDSKFPGDRYSALQDAYDTGDPAVIAAAKKTLSEIIRKCAKDIRDKYISPPYTTNFGIMFLPFEGLYAEVVNSGLVEQLQRDYSVNVAGPSTMAALLNSLQMGFRTLAIQKRSNEVWELLGAVKTEFGNFEKVLTETRTHLRKVDEDLDKLVGVRTRQINRKLNNVEALPDAEAGRVLTDGALDA